MSAAPEGWRPVPADHRLRAAEAVPWVAAVVVYLLAADYLGLATQILIMSLFALSLDLIVGYAGIISLGHAAFFGAGAYTVGGCTSNAALDCRDRW